jgi:hypothetical protein
LGWLPQCAVRPSLFSRCLASRVKWDYPIAWTAIINSDSSASVPDIFITLTVLIFFVLGFVLGMLNIVLIPGITLLGVSGGLALGVRIAVVREGFLIQGERFFFVNWLMVALLGLAGGLTVVWNRRVGIVSVSIDAILSVAQHYRPFFGEPQIIGSASAGTFLAFLGVDLLINKQSGMSRGLRFLFDRNAFHTIASIYV